MHSSKSKKESQSNNSSNNDNESSSQHNQKQTKQKDNNGQSYWELGNKKRVTISDFKGKTYVNIRQYYEKDGQILPGKKGISLTIEQWEVLKSLQKSIDSEITQVKGIKGNKKVKKS